MLKTKSSESPLYTASLWGLVWDCLEGELMMVRARISLISLTHSSTTGPLSGEVKIWHGEFNYQAKFMTSSEILISAREHSLIIFHRSVYIFFLLLENMIERQELMHISHPSFNIIIVSSLSLGAFFCNVSSVSSCFFAKCCRNIFNYY